LKKTYGRVLAKNIKSNQDIPNYKNSAMDGYAVNLENTMILNTSLAVLASHLLVTPMKKV
jgi:molybdopterin biosynthesis enzyme